MIRRRLTPREGWLRFAITSLVAAAALTALASLRPGHNSPGDDWVAIGIGVAVVRLLYRDQRRRRLRGSR